MSKPAWLELYELAVLETENAALEQRIVEAEKAMSLRLAEIDDNAGDASQEQTTIYSAAKALKILRKERL